MSFDDSCTNCGRDGVNVKRVTRCYGRGADLLVIENIPMISCPHCYTDYFTARTLHEVERIKTLRKSLAVERTVPVADFSGKNG